MKKRINMGEGMAEPMKALINQVYSSGLIPILLNDIKNEIL